MEPPPPPVAPLGTLPSTYTKAIFTGIPLIDNQINLAAYALHQKAAADAGTALGTTAAKGVPLTQARLLTAGASGGALTAAFMAGWMLTDGTLAMYAHTTGTNALQGACSWEDFGRATVEVLYPLSSPDCGVAITNPNSDATGGAATLTVGGMTVKLNGYWRFNNPTVSDGACVRSTGSQPGGSHFQILVGGSWVNGGTPGGVFGDCSGMGDTNAMATIPSGVTYHVRLVTTSTGAVLGTMATPSSNPMRTPSCQLSWPDGTTTTATGTAAQKYQDTAGLPLATFSALCNDGFVSKPGHGPGLLPSEIKIGSTKEDTGAFTEIAKSPVPDFSPSEEKGLTPGTSGGLVLQRVIGTVASSCMTWEVSCAGWWTATSNGTSPTVGTDEYRCLWNGAAVSLLECGVYRHTFDTKTSTPTITDPVTGTDNAWVTAPATGSNPGAANSTSPGSSISPGDACFSSWPPFSLADPITWVMHPVYCAMVKAFVPRTSVVTGTIAGLGAQAGTIAGVDPLMALVAELPSGDGCDGLPIDLTFFGAEFHGRLLEACDGPGRAAATIVNGLLTLALITASIFAIGRYAAAVFGFVGPGGQMEHAQRQTERELERMDRQSPGVRFH